MDEITKKLIEEAEKYLGPLSAHQKWIAYKVANRIEDAEPEYGTVEIDVTKHNP